MSDIKLEILEYSYWEHYKYAKDISIILPINHPKRIRIEKELNDLITIINNIKKDKDNNVT